MQEIWTSNEASYHGKQVTFAARRPVASRIR
jgi:hypothetical protein